MVTIRKEKIFSAKVREFNLDGRKSAGAVRRDFLKSGTSIFVSSATGKREIPVISAIAPAGIFHKKEVIVSTAELAKFLEAGVHEGTIFVFKDGSYVVFGKISDIKITV